MAWLINRFTGMARVMAWLGILAIVMASLGERSLRRAIKALLDRGEIFVIAGEGGPGDPRRYVTVECFASTLKGGDGEGHRTRQADRC